MLVEIFSEAAAKCQYGGGDIGLARAWHTFLKSVPFREGLVAKFPNSHDAWLRSIDIDLQEGVPLDRLPHARAVIYREWLCSPFFIGLGEQWLATL
jgi:hypothetical protein